MDCYSSNHTELRKRRDT